jgi:hypothetical protein
MYYRYGYRVLYIVRNALPPRRRRCVLENTPDACGSQLQRCTQSHSKHTISSLRLLSQHIRQAVSTHLEPALRWPRGGSGRTRDGTHSSVRFSMLDRGSREGVRGRVCNRAGGDIGRTRVPPVGAERGGPASDGRHLRTRGTQEGDTGGLKTTRRLTRRRRQRD